MHPQRSWEELGGRFLGLIAYLNPKGAGDSSMLVKRRLVQVSGVMRRGTRAIWRKLDCLNPNLQEMQRFIHRKDI